MIEENDVRMEDEFYDDDMEHDVIETGEILSQQKYKSNSIVVGQKFPNYIKVWSKQVLYIYIWYDNHKLFFRNKWLKGLNGVKRKRENWEMVLAQKDPEWEIYRIRLVLIMNKVTHEFVI